jgi:hypothetical protein
LQEIRYLAKLKSEFIVNYNHSWVEVCLKEVKRKRSFNRVLEDENDMYNFNFDKKFPKASIIGKEYLDLNIEFFNSNSHTVGNNNVQFDEELNRISESIIEDSNTLTIGNKEYK